MPKLQTGLQTALETILEQYWGYANFRSGQVEIIQNIIEHKQVLALLATGGGKSICYQVAGLHLGGTTLVISPLISLMQDQVARLTQLNLAARVYNSTLTSLQKQTVQDELFAGKLKFLYLAPESLKNKQLQLILAKIAVNLVAIDEAHCISLWGHDFRSAYLDIRYSLATVFERNHCHIAAFTATATQKTVLDISKQLRFNSARVLRNSFARPNLAIKSVLPSTGLDILQLVKQQRARGPVLIYSSSRARVEELSQFLNAEGIKTDYYHAGRTPQQRLQIQTDFIANKLQVITATNAFGMGVDKPDIRTVVHERIPDSIENYYQEIGRAGRDGEDCESYVFINWRGINLRQQMLENSYLSPALANNFYNFLLSKHRQLNSTNFVVSYEELLTKLTGFNLAKLNKCLEVFTAKKIITCELKPAAVVFELLNSRVIFLSSKLNFGLERKLFQQKQKSLRSLVKVLTADNCRMQAILKYFSEDSQSCGKCDICVSQNYY